MFSWLRKFKISNRLDADGASPSGVSHGLQEYRDSIARVDAALRSDVDGERQAPSRALRRRTLDAIQATTWEESPSARWRWPRLVAAMGVLAVVAAVTATIFFRGTPTPDKDPDGDIAQLIKKPTALRLPDLTIAMEAPLLSEAKGLIADVRQAKDYMMARVPLRTASGRWAFSPASTKVR